MPLYIYLSIYIYVHIIHINCTKHCIDICVHFGHLFSFLITYGLRPFFSFLLSLVSLLIEARRFNSTRRNTRELIARTTWNFFSNHVLFRLFKDRLMSFSLSDSPLWTLTNRHVKISFRSLRRVGQVRTWFDFEVVRVPRIEIPANVRFFSIFFLFFFFSIINHRPIVYACTLPKTSNAEIELSRSSNFDEFPTNFQRILHEFFAILSIRDSSPRSWPRSFNDRRSTIFSYHVFVFSPLPPL